MNLPRHHSNRKEFSQYLLLGLPTVAFMAFGLFMANKWLPLLNLGWVTQSVAFAGGLFFAIFCFARRLRFVTLSLAIAGAMYAIHTMAEALLPKEFDGYFFIIGANNYFVLFLAGWLAGFGFSRSRFFTVLWSISVLASLILIIANISAPMQKAIMLASVPVVFYVGYIIYTGELLRNMNEDQTGFRWFVFRRILSFTVLFAIILSIALNMMKAEFSTIEKEWEDGGKPKQENERQSSLTRNDGMGTSTQKSMGLQGFNNRANKDSVMFVARLDNFFPDSDMPNPLYFVSDYYTRYDSLSQDFETDSLRPYNDLFQPDLLSMPLYYTLEDSGVLKNAFGTLNRQVVTAEVYKTSLSPRHFTAPSTAFFVQPISVPQENKDIYKSAYRAKMLVSDLNSAYFVYNPFNDPGLEYFQEQRFAALRTIEDFKGAPPGFLDYYTQMPQGGAFDSIRNLALKIVDTLPIAPIDKILAIRDYFLATDSSGNPTFRYSDNPGIPGIPGANRLTNFLFDSKKGYCAYYAGATLFLLRALGIPSRIATGFLTVDRSNKNPGWYWFYEDQAHAWVQVWFPGYGWLDFDTTVPSTETQEAPQPDQTPPLTSQTAWLVANGKVITLDTTTARLRMSVKDVLFQDMPFAPEMPSPFELDVSLARVLKDTGQVPLITLVPGMNIVAVSFSDQFKDIKASKNDNWKSVSEKWPLPLPIDEIKIIAPEPETQKTEAPGTKTMVPWFRVFKVLAGAALSFLLAAALFPALMFRWYAIKSRHAKTIKGRAFASYMASLLYMHQLGFKRKNLTAMQLAEKQIDPAFNTGFADFIRVYEKLKYSKHEPTKKELEILSRHFEDFIPRVRSQVPYLKRLKAFLKPGETLDFFTKPNILGSTKNTDIWSNI